MDSKPKLKTRCLTSSNGGPCGHGRAEKLRTCPKGESLMPAWIWVVGGGGGVLLAMKASMG